MAVRKKQSICQWETISHIPTNPLKAKRFSLSRSTNILFHLKRDGKNRKKDGKKWKSDSTLIHFLKGVEILSCSFIFILPKMNPVYYNDDPLSACGPLTFHEI